mmetsp:Transcript_37233/g.89837  ORF Transcript_37233/g.89837 Transcript_37233/m.89837 type:complete len:81 (-) Transcript_37233:61-303(-)
MLELDPTKAVKFLFGSIGHEAERVEGSKRDLGAKLASDVKGDSGGSAASLGGGEGGGGAGKGSEDGKLHHCGGGIGVYGY